MKDNRQEWSAPERYLLNKGEKKGFRIGFFMGIVATLLFEVFCFLMWANLNNIILQ